MSRRRRRNPRPGEAIELYFERSRAIGPSLALVVPLLIAYEVSTALLDPPMRNGAEAIVSEMFAMASPEVLRAVRWSVVGMLVVGVLASWWRSSWRVSDSRWVLVESLLFATVLGPLVGLMVGGIGLSVPSEPATGPVPIWLPFLLSVGAGLWEEVVFRLGLLGGLTVVLVRGLGVERRGALAIAVVASAVVFALYHHVGSAGEPVDATRLAFRLVAGTILGVLFILRGFAVVVYMHVFYDVLCDLRTLAT